MDSKNNKKQSSTEDHAAADEPAKKINANILIVIAIAVVAVAGVLVYISLASNHAPAGSGIQSAQANPNKQGPLFLSDIHKISTLNKGIEVSYITSNASTYLAKVAGNTMIVSTNQTITSFVLGKDAASFLRSSITYSNYSTKQTTYRNVTVLSYYNTTNATILCYNQTIYLYGSTNSVLNCYKGTGVAYFESFPFTLSNLGSIAPLANVSNVTYEGVSTIDGISCNGFAMEELSSMNPANYSTYVVCLDAQYGIPVYLNTTVVRGRNVSSTAIEAVDFSTNVSSSDFVIPSNYLQNAKPING